MVGSATPRIETINAASPSLNMRFAGISLDFYGTLVEVVTIYNSVCKEIIADNGLNISPTELSLEWRQAQRAFEQSGERAYAYKEILRNGFLVLAEKYGVENAERYPQMLFERWREMPAYPEVPSALLELKKHYSLAICSNSSREFYDACAQKLPVKFDFEFLSEETGFTKPNPKMYELVRNAFKAKPSEVFHVASSQMDVAGAKKAGFAVCWINRHKETRLPETAQPDFEIERFDELLCILEI